MPRLLCLLSANGVSDKRQAPVGARRAAELMLSVEVEFNEVSTLTHDEPFHGCRYRSKSVPVPVRFACVRARHRAGVAGGARLVRVGPGAGERARVGDGSRAGHRERRVQEPVGRARAGAHRLVGRGAVDDGRWPPWPGRRWCCPAGTSRVETARRRDQSAGARERLCIPSAERPARSLPVSGPSAGSGVSSSPARVRRA